MSLLLKVFAIYLFFYFPLIGLGFVTYIPNKALPFESNEPSSSPLSLITPSLKSYLDLGRYSSGVSFSDNKTTV